MPGVTVQKFGPDIASSLSKIRSLQSTNFERNKCVVAETLFSGAEAAVAAAVLINSVFNLADIDDDDDRTGSSHQNFRDLGNFRIGSKLFGLKIGPCSTRPILRKLPLLGKRQSRKKSWLHFLLFGSSLSDISPSLARSKATSVGLRSSESCRQFLSF